MKPILWAAVTLLLSLAVLWLLLYPQRATGQMPDVSRETATTTPAAPPAPTPRVHRASVATTTLSESQIDVKRAVEAAFPDVPEMARVIACESGYAQFWPDGSPKISPTDDVGVMQINQTHWAQAKALGLDIFNSVDDNIKMGRIIYDEQGISAWTCSK